MSAQTSKLSVGLQNVKKANFPELCLALNPTYITSLFGILGAFEKLRKAIISFVMSVRPHISGFFVKSVRKFKFGYSRTRIKGTLHEDQ